MKKGHTENTTGVNVNFLILHYFEIICCKCGSCHVEITIHNQLILIQCQDCGKEERGIKDNQTVGYMKAIKKS